MIRKLIALFALGAATLAPPAFAQQAQTTPDVATAVANVQAFYNRTTTFSADFSQQYLAHAYNTTKTSAGHVIFSKPGKMDWEYTDPAGQRIVSDGTTLRVYQPAEKQMYEQTVKALGRIDESLAQCGSDKSRILSAMIYLNDVTQKRELNRAWDEWVDPNNPPMRACVGVDIEPPHLVEILITAAK